MAKTIGFACSIKLDWLNKMAQLLDENQTLEYYKNALNEYVAVDIKSPTRLRKTRKILLNIWYYENVSKTAMRQEARILLKKHPEYSAAIHYVMLCLSYPVVTDICKFFGRLFECQDVVTNTIVRQKLYDAWGERGTLQTTSRRVTLTLKQMGLLSEVKKGRYTLKKQEINHPDMIKFLIRSAMLAEGELSRPFGSMSNIEMLFPFSYQLLKEDLLMDENFTTIMAKGEMQISLNLHKE